MADESTAIRQLKKFMGDRGFKYLVEEPATLRGLFSGNNGQWNWVSGTSRDGRFLILHACCPMKMPEDRLVLVAEYLSRANWGMNFGNFDLDWSDGQVVFRTSVPVSSAGVSQKALEHLVYASFYLMDRYMPGLLSVGIGNVSPAEAIEKAEQGCHVPADEDATVDESDDEAHESPKGKDKPHRLSGFFPSDN